MIGDTPMFSETLGNHQTLVDLRFLFPKARTSKSLVARRLGSIRIDAASQGLFLRPMLNLKLTDLMLEFGL